MGHVNMQLCGHNTGIVQRSYCSTLRPEERPKTRRDQGTNRARCNYSTALFTNCGGKHWKNKREKSERSDDTAIELLISHAQPRIPFLRRNYICPRGYVFISRTCALTARLAQGPLSHSPLFSLCPHQYWQAIRCPSILPQTSH
jgi:hypothetical protein